MPDTPRTLLTQAQMAGGVEDLANQIAQVHAGASEIALVGIHTRGVPLARRIAAALEKKGGPKVHFGTIEHPA